MAARPLPRLTRRHREATPTRRQPSIVTERKQLATTTKATAVPWPEITLRTMPQATVETTTAKPSRTDAPSRRRPVTTSQPPPRPARNGHAVEASPATLIPREWAARPITTKTSTAAMSAATLAERIRRKLVQAGPLPQPAASGQLSAGGVLRGRIGPGDLAIGELFRLTLRASPPRRANRQLLVPLRHQLRALR